jgi:hypothetical protein
MTVDRTLRDGTCSPVKEEVVEILFYYRFVGVSVRQTLSYRTLSQLNLITRL